MTKGVKIDISLIMKGKEGLFCSLATIL